jgi:hypothetical protein
MTSISAAETSTINIYQSGPQIHYNIDGVGDINIATWPVTINNSTMAPTQALKILFTTDIVLDQVNSFFICNSTFIQFGDISLKPDGTRSTITINNLLNYTGLIQNGFALTDGNNNIYVFNLFVAATGTTTLANSAGWIGAQYYSKAASENYIINCSSNGNMIFSSGGIVGEESAILPSANLTIRGCSSSGSIGEACGGIAGVACGSNSGNLIVEQCFSTGIISNYGGGIVGGSGGGDGGSVTITKSYSIGSITGTGAGGIIGDNAAFDDGVVVIENCYSNGSIASGSAGIYGENAATGIPGSATAINCYSSGTISPGGAGIFISGTVSTSNTYAANGSWNDATATANLVGFGTTPSATWLSTASNSPFILNNFGITPYNLNDILPSLALNQNYSQTIVAGNSTIAGVLAGNKNFSLLGSDNPSYASYFTILDAPSYTGGAITASLSTPGGTYNLIVYAVDDYTTTIVTITVIPITPVLRIRDIPPCCEPNVPQPNPQTTNYNSDVIINKKAGKTMDTSVDQYYTAYATGQRRGFTKPVFKSYHDYINYLQGKYK